tara:strand:+ start:248 stop:1078 length:831 start_codon:yes stop_codon:yes gene_type:complete
MKLIFFGDCMFGRNGHPFVENPFVNVEHILKHGSAIFFNLETTVSRPLLPAKFKKVKAFNYQCTGEQLDSLRKITKKPIFVSSVNNHSLDYGVQGHKNTMKFLKKRNFLCNSKRKVEHKNIVFFNATDHCGCKNPQLWAENIWLIDYDNLEPVFQRIRNVKDKFIVFSIHWGSNWVNGEMPQHIQEFGRRLIDSGVNIVFGHSAHHVVQNPVYEYNGGIIIHGLGDFVNDYSVDKKYKSNEALLCIVHKKGKRLVPELVPVKRKFVQGRSSIPFLK